MTTPTTIEERFEEKFGSMESNYHLGTPEEIKSFLQSEIDLAKEEERKEIVEMVENKKYNHLDRKVNPNHEDDEYYCCPDCLQDQFKNEAIKDVINLITKK